MWTSTLVENMSVPPFPVWRLLKWGVWGAEGLRCVLFYSYLLFRLYEHILYINGAGVTVNSSLRARRRMQAPSPVPCPLLSSKLSSPVVPYFPLSSPLSLLSSV